MDQLLAGLDEQLSRIGLNEGKSILEDNFDFDDGFDIDVDSYDQDDRMFRMPDPFSDDDTKYRFDISSVAIGNMDGKQLQFYEVSFHGVSPLAFTDAFAHNRVYHIRLNQEGHTSDSIKLACNLSCT